MAQHSDSAAAVETIPLDLSGPRPIAMLTIGDSAPVPVVFDTGAGGNMLDVAYADAQRLPHLGPVAVGSPAGGAPVQGYRTRIAAARLGGAALTDVAAIVLPMSAPRARGVFGPATFAGRLVLVDLGRGEIRIVPRSPATVPAGAGFAYSEGGLPGIDVAIGGTVFPGHIDTGSNGALLVPTRLADQLPLVAPPRPVARARLADGSEVEVMGAQINGTVRIGPLALEHPEVRFIAGLQRINVGMGVLRGLTIVLDPQARRAWLVR